LDAAIFVAQIAYLFRLIRNTLMRFLLLPPTNQIVNKSNNSGEDLRGRFYKVI